MKHLAYFSFKCCMFEEQVQTSSALYTNGCSQCFRKETLIPGEGQRESFSSAPANTVESLRPSHIHLYSTMAEDRYETTHPN